VNELLPGIEHWTAFHENIEMEVSSYYVGPAATLIDPMLPKGGLSALHELGPPERIVLTNRHHYRHSGEITEEFDIPVLCHEAGLHEFEGGPAVEGFAFGEELAPGIVALEVGAICPEETALHIQTGGGTLAFADAVINYGGLRFVPDQLLGDDPDGVKRGVRDSARKLLVHEFDNLLFAHGEPLIGGGGTALREFVEE
jgi:hypothetical protein